MSLFTSAQHNTAYVLLCSAVVVAFGLTGPFVPNNSLNGSASSGAVEGHATEQVRNLTIPELGDLRAANSFKEMWEKVSNDQFFEFVSYYYAVHGTLVGKETDDPKQFEDSKLVLDAMALAVTRINNAIDLEINDNAQDRQKLMRQLIEFNMQEQATAAVLSRTLRYLSSQAISGPVPIEAADLGKLIVAR